MSERPLTSVAL